MDDKLSSETLKKIGKLAYKIKLDEFVTYTSTKSMEPTIMNNTKN